MAIKLTNKSHRQAEERYNVRIKYVPYPTNASWGGARIQAMIEATIVVIAADDTTILVLTGFHNLRMVVIGAVDEF